MTDTKPNFEPSELLEKLSSGLTEKQLRWCEHYQSGMSAIDALDAAGLATGDRAADNIEAIKYQKSSRLKMYMDEMNKCVAKDSGITMAWIDRKWGDIASANVADIIEIGRLYETYTKEGLPSGAPYQIISLKQLEELTPAQLTAIKKIEPAAGGVKIELHDKMKALEMLAKRRDFVEKSEVNHTGNVQVVTFVGNNGRGPVNKS